MGAPAKQHAPDGGKHGGAAAAAASGKQKESGAGGMKKKKSLSIMSADPASLQPGQLFQRNYVQECAKQNLKAEGAVQHMATERGVKGEAHHIKEDQWPALGMVFRKTTTLQVISLTMDPSRGMSKARVPPILTESIYKEFYRNMFRGLSVNEVLEHLDLSGMPLPVFIARQLGVALAKNSVMTTLALRHCKIGDKGFEALIPFLRSNTVLRTLDLTGNELTDNAGRFIASLVKMHSFERQSQAWANSLRGGVFKADGSHGLATLIVADNCLSDRFVEALATSLASDEFVTDVNLANNEITSEGLAMLADMLKVENKTLLRLNVTGNAPDQFLLNTIQTRIRRNRSLVSGDSRQAAIRFNDDGQGAEGDAGAAGFSGAVAGGESGALGNFVNDDAARDDDGDDNVGLPPSPRSQSTDLSQARDVSDAEDDVSGSAARSSSHASSGTGSGSQRRRHAQQQAHKAQQRHQQQPMGDIDNETDGAARLMAAYLGELSNVPLDPVPASAPAIAMDSAAAGHAPAARGRAGKPKQQQQQQQQQQQPHQQEQQKRAPARPQSAPPRRAAGAAAHAAPGHGRASPPAPAASPVKQPTRKPAAGAGAGAGAGAHAAVPASAAADKRREKPRRVVVAESTEHDEQAALAQAGAADDAAAHSTLASDAAGAAPTAMSTAEHEALAAALASASTELSELRAALSNERLERERLQIEVAQERTLRAKLEHEVVGVHGRVEQLQGQLARTEEELARVRGAAARHEEENGTLRALADDAQQQLAKLRASNAELDALNSDLREQLAKLQAAAGRQRAPRPAARAPLADVGADAGEQRGAPGVKRAHDGDEADDGSAAGGERDVPEARRHETNVQYEQYLADQEAYRAQLAAIHRKVDEVHLALQPGAGGALSASQLMQSSPGNASTGSAADVEALAASRRAAAREQEHSERMYLELQETVAQLNQYVERIESNRRALLERRARRAHHQHHQAEQS